MRPQDAMVCAPSGILPLHGAGQKKGGIMTYSSSFICNCFLFHLQSFLISFAITSCFICNRFLFHLQSFLVSFAITSCFICNRFLFHLQSLFVSFAIVSFSDFLFSIFAFLINGLLYQRSSIGTYSFSGITLL